MYKVMNASVIRKMMFGQLFARACASLSDIRSGVAASVLSALLLAAAATAPMQAQAAPPSVFYSDLQSGPNTGGENNNGAYVTIYGKRFGASQGASYVSVGSGRATNYKVWSDSKVSFQLGAGATTGNISVTTSAGISNLVPFTVRAGSIYFVATSGRDSNNGSFASPWQTIPHAAAAMRPGDVTYVRDGVAASADSGYGSPLNITGNSGTAASPIALIVYPGESASIGGSGNSRGVTQYPSASAYWTISGFNMTFPGSSEAIHIYPNSTNWRIIGNSISCPNGSGSTGCVTSDGAPYIDFLGNTLHDTGCPGSMATGPCGDTQKTYHAFYFGDLTGGLNHDINVGWNTVRNIYACRAIQFHSKDESPGYEAYGLRIHDNFIYNVRCDGINLANINPDKGNISVYNNVLWHVGTGPDPSGQAANYACINTSDSNGTPRTPVEVYNNTCYDGGSRGASEGDAGAYSFFIPTRMRNNLTYQLVGESYFTRSAMNGCSGCATGSNNLWFGLGSGPSQTTANINVDPLLVNPAGRDFHIQSGSPAKDAGVAISGLASDGDGISRPQGSGYDLGAYEFLQSSTSGTSPNSCDLNGDGAVDGLDVQIAVNQTIGVASCSSADLEQTGTCSIVDVQRVVNTSLGQSCRVGH